MRRRGPAQQGGPIQPSSAGYGFRRERVADRVIISTEVHARAGLLGNPSDMYGGKVISFLIRDFSAHVRLWESPTLTLKPHPEHDRTEFENLSHLANSIERHRDY